MEILNTTPLRFAPMTGRLPFPGHSLTLIVKGTFDLEHGRPARLAEDQFEPTDDAYAPEDQEQTGSPRYEGDFAPLKPRADLLLVGSCHVPGGAPAVACDVGFRVGHHGRTLRVFGDRFWKHPWISSEVVSRGAFTEMPLTYELAYGGPHYPANPVGTGHRKVTNGTGLAVYPLPNVEDPAQPIRSYQDRVDPAGFGPLGRTWQLRRDKLGSYRGDYLEKRWPWFAADCDLSYCNAAPPQMQVEGYLRGDEPLSFQHLHPRHPHYESRLPGLRVRAFVSITTSDGVEPEFREVPLNLDTLWVDMEAERLVLVWRGWTEVCSEDCDEVEHVFLVSEPREQEPASLEACRQQFLAKKKAEEEAWAMEPEEPEVPPAEKEAEVAPVKEAEVPRPMEPAIDRAQFEGQVEALLAEAGFDLETLPPAVRTEMKERQERLMRKLAETDPEKLAEMESAEAEAQMREALAKLDLDLDQLPSLSPKAAAEQNRFLHELGLDGAELGAAPELGRFGLVLGALLPKMGMDPENLQPLIDEAKKQQARMQAQPGGTPGEPQVEGSQPEPEPEPQPGDRREEIRIRGARGESFAEEDLSELDLSGLDLANANFAGAVLAGTNFRGASLASANLSQANLSRADFTGARLAGAKLDGADATEAIFDEADLAGATLTDALLEKVRMRSASLDGVAGSGAIFSDANLAGSRFVRAELRQADFSGCVLEGANMATADLAEALLEGVSAARVDLSRAELTGLRAGEGSDLANARLVAASGPGSMWNGANLTGADLTLARMADADFSQATLAAAHLTGADLRGARLIRADLRGADLNRMNLFQANLAKANLTGADLRGSNLYGAELLDTVVEAVRLDGANIKRTKLEMVR